MVKNTTDDKMLTVGPLPQGAVPGRLSTDGAAGHARAAPPATPPQQPSQEPHVAFQQVPHKCIHIEISHVHS